MQLLPVLLLAAAFIATVTSTPVQSCSGGPHEKSDDYFISNCERPPCKLKRGSDVSLEFKFTPTEDVPSLKNSVFAKIIGVPFPFIGVDGTNACDQVFLPDGTKAGCPLKAGTQYVYKNAFKVLEIYPKLKVTVHWALSSPSKDVLCFDVPARITS